MQPAIVAVAAWCPRLRESGAVEALLIARQSTGCIYLGAMAVSIFSQVYVLGRIVVPGSAAATAINIAQSETLFRSGIVLDVVTFVSDVVIAWAFYELLRGVDRGLALLGAFLRIADAAILAVTTVSGLVTLRLLSGADYLQGFAPAQLESLARLFISARGLGFGVGFVFLGLGSAVFAYVLFKSRYVPRALAGWGIFASLLLGLGALAEMLSPWFSAHVSMLYMVPMFFYEVPLGLWFLIKGVEAPAPRPALARG
jgi:hypothetical protein